MRLRPALAAPLFALAALALPALAAAPLMLGSPARAAPVEVDIDKGDVQPLPIAVAPLTGADARTAGLGADIARVIDANLQRSGFFKPLDPTSFVGGTGGDVDVQPRFADWRAINAHALVNGRASLDADGRLRVDFRLWDTFNEQQLLGLQFTATPEDWRRIAHKISDAVYTKLTGEAGYFDSRVVFVAESGTRAHRVKRLAIMDQDGANPSFLTDGSTLVLTPRFSASGQEITYMALSQDTARVYLFNIETGRRESLGSFSGMVFAPRFSPDGNRVAFSVVHEGNADIYVMDLRSRAVSRLTTEPSIDTSPSFSPDGSRLVFNSDRGGSPQLYVMSAEGGGAHRISFGSGRYTAPVWSPKGDFIAATKQTGSSFHIVVMRPDGSEERTLTSSYLDEGPTWAPNGRVIMFSRETPGRGPRLYTVDISGRDLQAEPYSAPATDPAWSPLLR